MRRRVSTNPVAIAKGGYTSSSNTYMGDVREIFNTGRKWDNAVGFRAGRVICYVLLPLRQAPGNQPAHAARRLPEALLSIRNKGQ